MGYRWLCWFLALIPFAYIVYELLVGLAEATDSEPDDTVRGLIKNAQIWTVISWLTYPVVYVLPMLGFSGAQAVVGIQCGYCVSDIISKCGVASSFTASPRPSPLWRQRALSWRKFLAILNDTHEVFTSV